MKKVAAIRLLLFTGAQSPEIMSLRWRWVRGSCGVLPGSKTGPKMIQLPSPARAVLKDLPRKGKFVFPCRKGDGPLRDSGERCRKLRGLTGLDNVHLHDCSHMNASQAVMSGLDLYTAGRLLGHRKRETTAVYAHLDDAALRDAAAQSASVIAKAMGFGTEANLLLEEANDIEEGEESDWLSNDVRQGATSGRCEPARTTIPCSEPDQTEAKRSSEKSARHSDLDWLGVGSDKPNDGATGSVGAEPNQPLCRLRWF